MSSDRPTPAKGQRRPRPHSYTAQACERCRTRKQRCIVDAEDDETCRNCLNSGAVCVFAAKSDRAKRSRRETSTAPKSDDESPPSPHALPQPFDPMPSHPPSHPPDPSSSAAPSLPLDYTSLPPPDPWPTWAPSGPSDMSRSQDSPDWRAWIASLTSHERDSLPLPAPPPPMPSSTAPPPHAVLPDPSPSDPLSTTPPVISTAAHRVRSPEDSEGSVFETAKGLAMISLEAAAEPHYVGESSGSLWTTVIVKGMQASYPTYERVKHTAAERSRSPSPTQLTVLRSHLRRPLSDEVANYVLQTVYRHLQARYPFMDWLAFDKQWQHRNAVLLAVAQDKRLDKETSVAAFFILMVLAVGAQICTDQGRHLQGLLRPADYYALASPYMATIVQLHNLANVQGLLLLAIYSLRDSRGPSVWYLSGVTLRLCVGLGLHRAPSRRARSELSSHKIEMRKRIFWTCYTLDRMMSMLLGRPLGISDEDIDVDYPSSSSAPSPSSPAPALPFLRTSAASLVSATHYVKLKRIESQIQRAVYTVAGPKRAPAHFWALLGMIDQWEAQVPEEASRADCWDMPCCSQDWFQLRGVEARLHLLRPLCTYQQDTREAFLVQLARNAARGCELQKRTHQSGLPSSSTSVHSTFISGLALLYAVFLRPDVMPLREVFSAIKAASNTMFAYSQRDKTSLALYNVFEELSSKCIDRMSGGGALAPTAQAPEQVFAEWDKVSMEVASGINSTSASEYVDLLRSLGIAPSDEPTASHNTPFADSLWDLAAFTPGTLMPSDHIAE